MLPIQRILLVIGALIILAALFWKWIVKIPFGKLPGDIIINKPTYSIHIPITTMIIISIIISIIFWLFRR